METKRPVGSSSSFAADLFGSKDSSSSPSKGIFSSIFALPSSVGGRNSSGSKVLESWPKQPMQDQLPNKEERVEPCHFSSSLYYGGRDSYSHSSSGQTSTPYPIFKKDGGEDDPNGNNSMDASRGNWWQGSLYY
ncbi:universal stress protein A-like protein-like [Hibiscus syriacus]|uniref:Universal stress protein A-like protein-like n=1 Tax=Hibiscus syriacus TaxID=106335 RepID=A0A6A3CQC8_HIBSY|nr:universal stress protein A-like protein-like [Hibiscus syriacus]